MLIIKAVGKYAEQLIGGTILAAVLMAVYLVWEQHELAEYEVIFAERAAKHNQEKARAVARLAALLQARAGEAITGPRLEQAAHEIRVLIFAGDSYVLIEGNTSSTPEGNPGYAVHMLTAATGLQTLKNAGYIVREYTDGRGENTYGKNITIATQLQPPAGLVITYEADTAANCEQLRDRIANRSGVEGYHVVCAGPILTLKLT